LADDARQVGRAEAGVERADARPRLAEAGRVRGDRQVAKDVKDVAAADRVAVHGRDHRLRHLADQAVQVLDLEQPGLGRAVVAGLRALLLVAAGAERAVARAGQADDADLRVGPRAL